MVEFSELGSHGHGCCKKHPNHQEKQGVCPYCLRERLTNLCSVSHKDIVTKSRIVPSDSPSLCFSPADYSSVSSSNCASPAASNRKNLLKQHKRNGSEVVGINGSSSSSSSFTVNINNVLKKSRSIAFVPRNFDDDNEEVENGKKKKKKKKGFLSKLFRLKGKNKEVLKHSSSFRLIIERVN